MPSADLPHLLSLIRLTIAARSLAHSASHSSMVVGSLAAVVAVVAAVLAVDPLAAAVVVVDAAPLVPLSLSSPPQAAATSAKPTPAATQPASLFYDPMTPLSSRVVPMTREPAFPPGSNIPFAEAPSADGGTT